jgi:hypothetical protein
VSRAGQGDDGEAAGRMRAAGAAVAAKLEGASLVAKLKRTTMALAQAAALLGAPSPASTHAGEYRDVLSRPPVRRPGGLPITKYCGVGDLPQEGAPCQHAGGIMRVSHWSCCGAEDEGAPCALAVAPGEGAGGAEA